MKFKSIIKSFMINLDNCYNHFVEYFQAFNIIYAVKKKLKSFSLKFS